MLASPSSLLASAFALLATASVVSASDGVFDPSKGTQSKIDYQPAITSPKGGEVFIAGQEYTASWNQQLPSNIPAGNVSQTADLLLGYDEEGSSSLHLNWTLEKNISLYAPNPDSVTFTVPEDIPSRDTYFLVLLGSTHNQSPRFSIVGNILPSGSPSNSSGSDESVGDANAGPVAAGKGEDAEEGGLVGFFHNLGFRRVRRSEMGKARLDN
ncbi:hypothetical protein JCM3770_003697 [Rhodotorula araucariae]